MRQLFDKYNSFQLLFDNESNSGGGSGSVAPLGGDKSGDIDDIINFFDSDSTDKDTIDLNKPVETRGKVKDEETDEEDDVNDNKSTKDDEDDETEEEEDIDDELEELAKDDEEPTEEQLELVTPVRRKEILKKYPELFKDFPYLEKAYYREQQYTEILPTIEDAKNAVEKSETLDKFEADLIKGSVETIFGAIKKEQPNSFAKIVDDLLPAINRVDPQAFNHILANTMKHTIASMAIEAKRSDNDNLRAAAQILNQFIFGSSDYKPPTRLSRDEIKDDKADELSRREQEFTTRQFNTAKGDMNTRVNNTLRNTIEGNIDPRGSMTDYVKKNAVRAVSEDLQSLLSQDTRFAKILDNLWEKAFNKNFSQESLDTIRSAYLSKARTLLPSVIKKARNEALKGMGKRTREVREDDTNEPEEKSSGKPRPSNRSGKDSKVPAGMSTYEFLSQD